MPSAQRTLVKSPPELWAEVSDVARLAKHLGEFGEVRITRLEPETTVAWEGHRVRGTVQLEPSGWGTKVTLTAEAEEAPVVEELAPEAAQEAELVEPPVPVPETPVAVEEPVAATAPAPEAPAADVSGDGDGPAPRWGFFARLFGRRRRSPVAQDGVVTEDVIVTEPVDETPPPTVPEPVPLPVPPPAEPAPLPPAAVCAGEAEAVLVAVLDDLGAAHHRPFSR
jgi:hypothetical protein